VLIHSFDNTPLIGCEENTENIWLMFDYKPAKFNLIEKSLKSFPDNPVFKDNEFHGCKRINQRVVFYTEKGLYRYNKSDLSFEKDTVFSEMSEGERPIDFIDEISPNKFLSLSQTYKFSKIKIYDYSSSMPVTDSLPYKRASGYVSVYNDGDSIIWGVSSKKIYKFNIQSTKDLNIRDKILIRKITIGSDSVYFAGSFSEEEIRIVSSEQTENFIPELAYTHNDISIEFSLTGFDDEASNEFSYRLVGGKNKDWSKWTKETFKEYTNLYEGDYVFKVKGRNIYGIESQVTEFKFTILPPWYRTWWALLSYLIIMVLIIRVIIVLNARRLKNENIKLDRIVRERTAEILMQKEEIQTQADDLEQKNHELNQKNEEISSIAENLRDANYKIKEKNLYITDSINYAKRIQNAVLPGEDEISSVLSDYFMIYKPKDIVGGDFYYVKRVKHYVIFAVADCTGHGVPGGFLSMMGTSLLNDILLMPEILSPAEALELMRMRVKNALRQKDYLSARADGIDMALCVIDTKKCELMFSGANLNAYIIKSKDDSEIIELKSDQQPIGIHYNEKPFTVSRYDLEPDDMIYLFTDGIYDQFGGEHNKKYLLPNLLKLLKRISKESLKIQKRNILNSFNTWKGKLKQVDDVLLLGVKNSNLCNYSE
jgi:serine phosphatase RsbU (regulator of sigma subunit)